MEALVVSIGRDESNLGSSEVMYEYLRSDSTLSQRVSDLTAELASAYML